MTAHLHRCARGCLVLLLAFGLSACALFQARDPLNISVIGIEPLPGQELELRMAVKIRVQNPNEPPIDYNGIALDLPVNGQPLDKNRYPTAGQGAENPLYRFPSGHYAIVIE